MIFLHLSLRVPFDGVSVLRQILSTAFEQSMPRRATRGVQCDRAHADEHETNSARMRRRIAVVAVLDLLGKHRPLEVSRIRLSISHQYRFHGKPRSRGRTLCTSSRTGGDVT